MAGSGRFSGWRRFIVVLAVVGLILILTVSVQASLRGKHYEPAFDKEVPDGRVVYGPGMDD